MNKVIVNKEVARLLGKVEAGSSIALADGNVGRLVFWFLERVSETASRGIKGCSTQAWLDANGVSVADIEQAFKHGWEEEYEFKEGDIVSYIDNCARVTHRVIEQTDGTHMHFSNGGHLSARHTEVTLVCKREDRCDLK